MPVDIFTTRAPDEVAAVLARARGVRSRAGDPADADDRQERSHMGALTRLPPGDPAPPPRPRRLKSSATLMKVYLRNARCSQRNH